MKKNIFKYMMIGCTVLVTGACTNLEVKELDSVVVSADGTFTGVDATASLTSAYNDFIQSTQENWYALNEATTDEIFIPTRGTDWGDNGVWRDLARHAWNGSHQFNYQAWNFFNTNVYRTNQILHPATTSTPLQKAEAKFIRAYNMFWILDMWRQVPFRDADEGPDVNPKVLKGQEAYDFIVKDLTEALADLPATPSGAIGDQNRASKAAAHLMLAKLYLNHHIYTGATAADNADLAKVISEVEAIEADGYTLQDGFFRIFGADADSETILYVNAGYDNRIWGSLHYNQGRETDNEGGGWNGFATTADFYNTFEGDANTNAEGGDQEERRGFVPANSLGVGFLIGEQGGPNNPLDRAGRELSFSKNVESLTGQPDYTGIRLLKWHPGVQDKDDPDKKSTATINMAGSYTRHMVALRYADAFLMKMEAMFRSGDTGGAQDMLNEIRTLRKASAKTITEQEILDERGRELYLEGWRRNDMVRFGKFASTFAFNENSDVTRNVFPIPDNALGSNPNLQPNEGY